MLVFDRGGRSSARSARAGRGPGQLLAPSAVAIYAAGPRLRRRHRQRADRALHHRRDAPRLLRPLPHHPRRSRSRPTARASTAPTRRTNRITVLTGTGGDLAEIGARGSEPGELRAPAGSRSTAPGNVWVADRGNDRDPGLHPRRNAGGALRRARRRRRAVHRADGVSVGLQRARDRRRRRQQPRRSSSSSRPARACAPLPAVKNPPDPILYNQPQPLPPEVTVRPTRTSGILAIRQFPLRVSSDLPGQDLGPGRR